MKRQYRPQTMIYMETTDPSQFTIAHDLYPKDCMVEAIDRFRDVCSIYIMQPGESESVISIRPVSHISLQPNVVACEFLNYLLTLSCRSVIADCKRKSPHRKWS